LLVFADDVLVVTKLNRLARSTLDLLRIIDLARKALLQEPWRSLGRHHDTARPPDADRPAARPSSATRSCT